MLPSTKEFIGYLWENPGEKDFSIMEALLAPVMLFGKQEDGEALIQTVFNHPFDIEPELLRPIFKRFGRKEDAHRLYDTFIHKENLLNPDYSEVFRVLGNMGYRPVVPVLLEHAFQKDDHEISKNAIMGLLHFDCGEHTGIFTHEIEEVMEKSLFSEFVPALVCKVPENGRLLHKLYEFGSTLCSTDCNAGILLGFSLSGTKGGDYFKKALFGSHWEAGSFSTGTVHYAYQGMENLKIRFKDIWKDILQMENKTHPLDVFLSLLEVRLRLPLYASAKAEPFLDIYQSVFSGLTTESGIYKTIWKHDLLEQFYQMEKEMQMRLREEMIVKACTGTSTV